MEVAEIIVEYTNLYSSVVSEYQLNVECSKYCYLVLPT
jgi:hypothetical protein